MKTYFRVGLLSLLSLIITTLPVKAQHHSTSEEWPEPVEDQQTYSLFNFDELEYRNNQGEDTFNWDAEGWVGGDYNKIWLKTEGEVGLEEGATSAEIQVLYSRNIAPFWDLQTGVRYDRNFSNNGDKGRGFAVIGIEGLAPYLFDLEGALFISEKGDVSARVKAEYEFLLNQKLILQPKIEINLAAQQVEEFGVGTGLNDLELGLRLRYEINRQIAPYLGISWEKKFAGTADLAEKEGEKTDNFSLIGGIKLMF